MSKYTHAKCDCHVRRYTRHDFRRGAVQVEEIIYCKVHSAAPQLAEALEKIAECDPKRLDKFDAQGFVAIARAALALVEGK